jgi:hypothetical protein
VFLLQKKPGNPLHIISHLLFKDVLTVYNIFASWDIKRLAIILMKAMMNAKTILVELTSYWMSADIWPADQKINCWI